MTLPSLETCVFHECKTLDKSQFHCISNLDPKVMGVGDTKFKAYSNLVEILQYKEKQMKITLESFQSAFVVPQPRKTVKLQVKEGTTLEMASLLAFRYVMDNTEGITQVEFKYGRAWIVISKLKD